MVAKRVGKAQKQRRTVADLVAGREKQLPKFTPEQKEQVAEAIRHNDVRVGTRKRLSVYAINDLLRDDYGFEYGPVVFERMVCVEFSRRSWATK